MTVEAMDVVRRMPSLRKLDCVGFSQEHLQRLLGGDGAPIPPLESLPSADPPYSLDSTNVDLLLRLAPTLTELNHVDFRLGDLPAVLADACDEVRCEAVSPLDRDRRCARGGTEGDAAADDGSRQLASRPDERSSLRRAAGAVLSTLAGVALLEVAPQPRRLPRSRTHFSPSPAPVRSPRLATGRPRPRDAGEDESQLPRYDKDRWPNMVEL
jgi:hypothetical protein